MSITTKDIRPIVEHNVELIKLHLCCCMFVLFIPSFLQPFIEVLSSFEMHSSLVISLFYC